jgi:aspartate aminotransferase/aminotransferase
MNNNVLKKIPEALSIKINQKVYEKKRQGKDIITLSLGEAFFDMPLLDFNKIDYTKGFHYSDTQGIPELRNKLAKFYNLNYRSNIDSDNILVTAGSKLAIYLVLKAILNYKDEVILIEPSWLSYADQISLCNAKPIFLPYKKKITELKKFLSKKTKAIIINNPNNPSGYLYGKKDILFLYRLCKLKKIKLIIDEAYSDFISSKSFVSGSAIDRKLEHTIIVNSISKNMGMSGWRVGYVISNKLFLKNILKLNQHIITCAPTILQLYISSYFEKILSFTRPQIFQLNKKRIYIENFLKRNKITIMKSTSTFYFMIKILKNLDSIKFCEILLNSYNVAAVPGIAYGKSCKNYIRIGIGTESIERIKQALIIIKDRLYFEKRNRKKTN